MAIILGSIGFVPGMENTSWIRKSCHTSTVPCGVVAYTYSQHDKSTWIKIDPVLSRTLSAPPDPIYVRHVARFEKLFAELKKETGTEFAIEVVENQYCRNPLEPWYKFTIGNKTFTVGPRKRVTAVEVESTDEFRVTALATLVEQADNPTFVLDKCPYEKKETCHRLTVHAWTTEHLLQFLVTIIKDCPNVETVTS